MPEHDISEVLQRLAVIESRLITQGDHETRIRALEKWRYVATGTAAAVGAAGGSLVPLLLQALGGG